MLLLLSHQGRFGYLSFATIRNLITSNPILFSVIGIVIFLGLLILGIVKNRKKKRSKKKEEVSIRPVTDIIGNEAERLDSLNQDLESFGFAYDHTQDYFYSTMYGWQRRYGYCRLYDEAAAPLSMIIDCEPIRFEYAGKHWLIEFWKGQYGMTTGGEVGIYYTDGPAIHIPGLFNGTFYYCVEDQDRINMSFALRKNGNLLFTRSSYHWWLTGFKLAEFSKPSELSMDIILTLYDKQMCHAFVDALKKAGYKSYEYKVRGRSVMIKFTEPHTTQPLSRSPLTEFLAQRNNEHWCNVYQRLTSAYADTLDQLDYIRYESPSMYQRILKMGKPVEQFDSFYNIRSYLDDEEEGM